MKKLILLFAILAQTAWGQFPGRAPAGGDLTVTIIGEGSVYNPGATYRDVEYLSNEAYSTVDGWEFYRWNIPGIGYTTENPISFHFRTDLEITVEFIQEGTRSSREPYIWNSPTLTVSETDYSTFNDELRAQLNQLDNTNDYWAYGSWYPEIPEETSDYSRIPTVQSRSATLIVNGSRDNPVPTPGILNRRIYRTRGQGQIEYSHEEHINQDINRDGDMSDDLRRTYYIIPVSTTNNYTPRTRWQSRQNEDWTVFNDNDPPPAVYGPSITPEGPHHPLLRHGYTTLYSNSNFEVGTPVYNTDRNTPLASSGTYYFGDNKEIHISGNGIVQYIGGTTYLYSVIRRDRNYYIDGEYVDGRYLKLPIKWRGGTEIFATIELELGYQVSFSNIYVQTANMSQRTIQLNINGSLTNYSY